jgi:hypothetical protein
MQAIQQQQRVALIEEANNLVKEGQSKHRADLAKLFIASFTPEEIALICDHLIKIVQSFEEK